MLYGTLIILQTKFNPQYIRNIVQFMVFNKWMKCHYYHHCQRKIIKYKPQIKLKNAKQNGKFIFTFTTTHVKPNKNLLIEALVSSLCLYIARTNYIQFCNKTSDISTESPFKSLTLKITRLLIKGFTTSMKSNLSDHLKMSISEKGKKNP